MIASYILITNLLLQEYKNNQSSLVMNESGIREKVEVRAEKHEVNTNQATSFKTYPLQVVTANSRQQVPDRRADNSLGNSNKHPSSDKGVMSQNVLIKQTKPIFSHKSDWGFFLRPAFLCSVEERRGFFQRLLEPYLISDSSNLVMGLVFGGGQNLEKSFKNQVRIAGLSHVLSASGSNVSLVLLINSPFIRRKFGSLFTLLTSILAVSVYLSIAGCTAPLFRAAISAILALLGHSLWKRKISQAWLLGITGGVMLLISADYLTDVSFQLSMAATYGLLASTKLFPDKSRDYLDDSISGIKHGCYHSTVASDSFSRVLSGMTIFTNYLRGWVLAAMRTTLAVQLFTLPIVIGNFHQLSILGIVSNVAIVWVVPLLIAVTLLTIFCSFFHFSLFAVLFGHLTNYLSNFFISTTRFLGSHQSFLLQLSESQTTCLLLIYFVLLLVYFVCILSRRKLNKKGERYLCR
ncbi:ComEC/Rec2 family competence protein [Patescibacteria group bacterium]|nr:ComEC/Rec2 family competence protein [Patescibacteria group bacterium]